MSDAAGLAPTRQRKKKLKTILDFALAKDYPETNGRKPLTHPKPAATAPAPQEPPPKPEKVSEPKKPVYRATTPPNIPRKKRGSSGMIRINNTNTEKDSTGKDPFFSYGNEHFDQEQLLEAWKEFSSITKKKHGGFTASILTKNQPKLNDDYSISLVFDNESGKIEFEKISDDLTVFLRKKFQNDKICFVKEVSEHKTEKKLYTNKEKFKHLTEKHPELLEWVKKFNLDIEL